MSFFGKTFEASAQGSQFMQFASQFNKVYETSNEFVKRYTLFQVSLAKIEAINNSEANWTAGINHMSDWTDEEYNSMLGLKDMPVEPEEPIWPFVGESSNSEGWDWRDTPNVVTPVKDQGQCGSCWAFSATEAVESAYAIAGNDLTTFAPQQLVDCDKSLFKSHGCSGGWYYYAYQYLSNHKFMKEEDYPYTSGVTQTESKCAYDSTKGVTNVSSYKQVSKNTDSIKAAIEIGPVNVAVAAGNDIFRNYQSGIVTEADGCPTRVDHAIVAVGYGYEGDQGYYIVRNSWTTSWGDAGYIKIGMADGKTGVCGINGYVYYPII